MIWWFLRQFLQLCHIFRGLRLNQRNLKNLFREHVSCWVNAQNKGPVVHLLASFHISGSEAKLSSCCQSALLLMRPGSSFIAMSNWTHLWLLLIFKHAVCVSSRRQTMSRKIWQDFILLSKFPDVTEMLSGEWCRARQVMNRLHPHLRRQAIRLTALSVCLCVCLDNITAVFQTPLRVFITENSRRP